MPVTRPGVIQVSQLSAACRGTTRSAMRAASQRLVDREISAIPSFERFVKDNGLVRGEGMASDAGGAFDAKK